MVEFGFLVGGCCWALCRAGLGSGFCCAIFGDALDALRWVRRHVCPLTRTPLDFAVGAVAADHLAVRAPAAEAVGAVLLEGGEAVGLAKGGGDGVLGFVVGGSFGCCGWVFLLGSGQA